MHDLLTAFSQKARIVETRLNAFQPILITCFRQKQLHKNLSSFDNAPTDSLFRHFRLSEHTSLLFLVRSQLAL